MNQIPKLRTTVRQSKPTDRLHEYNALDFPRNQLKSHYSPAPASIAAKSYAQPEIASNHKLPFIRASTKDFAPPLQSGYTRSTYLKEVYRWRASGKTFG